MNIENLIKKYNITPDLIRDQHFLNNNKMINEMIKALEINKNDIIVEIGPGLGIITKKIPTCKKIIAIEIDENLIKILKKEIRKKNLETSEITPSNLPASARRKKAISDGDQEHAQGFSSAVLDIINENALKIIDELKFTKLISSLPYSISEPLFYKLFLLEFEISVLIVPENFYKKIKEKKNKLGLYSDAFLDIEELRKIEKDNFYPIPKVASILLKISKKTEGNLILKELYLQRDKKVKNAISGTFVKHLNKTKRQARALLKNLALGKKLENMLIDNISYEELHKIEDILKTYIGMSK